MARQSWQGRPNITTPPKGDSEVPLADTTTSTLDNQLQTYYDKMFLEHFEPKLKLYEWAEKKPLPKNQGLTVTFTRWNSVGPASSKLGEGTPPASFSLSSTKVTATIAQYGRYTKITDLIDMTAISPVIEEAVPLLAESAAKTYERLLQMVIWRTDYGLSGQRNVGNSVVLSARMSSQLSGTKFNGGSDWGFKGIFATSVGRLSAVNSSAPSVSARFSKRSISRVVARLRSLDTPTVLNGTYVCYTDDWATRDLMNDDPNGWVEAYKYADPSMILMGEAGKIAGARIFTSSIVPRYRVTAHSCSLSFFFGKQAFGVSEIDGSARIIVKATENPHDKSDPLDQYGTVAYKWTAAVVTLNASCGRVLFTHTIAE